MNTKQLLENADMAKQFPDHKLTIEIARKQSAHATPYANSAGLVNWREVMKHYDYMADTIEALLQQVRDYELALKTITRTGDKVSIVKTAQQALSKYEVAE